MPAAPPAQRLPLPAPPSPWPWVAAAAITGLVCGTLLQGYVRTGVGFFRMFATIGVVWIGYCATRALAAAQQAAGLEELRAALAELPPGWAVAGPVATRDGSGRADLVVVGGKAGFLVALEQSSPFARAGIAARRRLAAGLWRIRRELEAALPEPPPLHLLICALQAPPRKPHPVDGALVVGPADLPLHMRRLEAEPDAAGRAPADTAGPGLAAMRRLLGCGGEPGAAAPDGTPPGG